MTERQLSVTSHFLKWKVVFFLSTSLDHWPFYHHLIELPQPEVDRRAARRAVARRRQPETQPVERARPDARRGGNDGVGRRREGVDLRLLRTEKKNCVV